MVRKQLCSAKLDSLLKDSAEFYNEYKSSNGTADHELYMNRLQFLFRHVDPGISMRGLNGFDIFMKIYLNFSYPTELGHKGFRSPISRKASH